MIQTANLFANGCTVLDSPLSSYNVLCCVFQMHIVTLGSCVVSVHCWNIGTFCNVYPWLLKHNLLASSRHNVIRGISTCWGDDWVMDSQSLDCLCINKQVLKRDTVPCYKAKLHEKHTAQDTSRAGYCQWTDVFSHQAMNKTILDKPRLTTCSDKLRR